MFSEIVSHKKIKLKDINHTIKGIVLSGGPLNVYQINKYSFDKKILWSAISSRGDSHRKRKKINK